jgi:hypothetical protein
MTPQLDHCCSTSRVILRALARYSCVALGMDVGRVGMGMMKALLWSIMGEAARAATGPHTVGTRGQTAVENILYICISGVLSAV